VAASVLLSIGSITGSTATGIAEFQGRRAGLAVAGRTRVFLVLFATGAGMEGGGFVLVMGFSGIAG
jgi:hypothetical protein